MVSISSVTTTGLLNNANAINEDDINCARNAQCCYLKNNVKDDPCDKLLITPGDGIQDTNKIDKFKIMLSSLFL